VVPLPSVYPVDAEGVLQSRIVQPVAELHVPDVWQVMEVPVPV